MRILPRCAPHPLRVMLNRSRLRRRFTIDPSRCAAGMFHLGAIIGGSPHHPTDAHVFTSKRPGHQQLIITLLFPQATHRVTFCTYRNSNFADERLQHGDPRVGTWASVSQANATGMHQRHAIRPLSSLPTACRALDFEGCMMRGRTLFIHRTVCFTSRLSHLAYVDHSWSFDPCLTEKGTAT